MNKAALNFPICVHLLDPQVYITPLRLDAYSARAALNMRINCYCSQRFLDRAEIALRLPIKNWNAINMNIRLSSTAPEFPVAQSEPQTSVVNKMNKQSPEFPVAQSEPQTSVVTYIKENSETAATQNDSFIGATLHIDPIIAFTISKCSTTFHNISAFQILNLHHTTIRTLL